MDKILKILDDIYKECGRNTIRVSKIRNMAIKGSLYAKAVENFLDSKNIDVTKEGK